MKWLLYGFSGILGLVLLAVIVLLIIGGGRGEGELVATVDIAKPPAAVFTWITEPAKMKSWVGWLVEVRNLTPGQSGVGSMGSKDIYVMEDRNNGNQRMNIETQVTRYEQDRLLEAQMHVPMGFTGAVTYELQPVDANKTRLTYRGSFKFEHWLAKLLEPVISRSARQKLDEDLQRLRQQAEAE